MSGRLLLRYKTAIVRELGKGPLDEGQIDEIGLREFGRKWGRTHPSDQLPAFKKDRFYVVNNAGHRSPGTHWLGVYSSSGGRIYVYDSFSRPVTRLIPRAVKKIREENILEEANFVPDQRGASSVCGQLSLAWLLLVRDMGIRKALEGVVDIV